MDYSVAVLIVISLLATSIYIARSAYRGKEWAFWFYRIVMGIALIAIFVGFVQVAVRILRGEL